MSTDFCRHNIRMCECEVCYDRAYFKRRAEDAERWKDATLDPSGYAHLFNLLAAGKGTVEQLNVMADRIGASRRVAMEAGYGTGPREPLKGALNADGGKR